MKNGFKGFQKTIELYLSQLADIDKCFAVHYRKKEKSIEECCNYIIAILRESAQNGCIGTTDDEVYNLAVHYYIEDNIRDIKDQKGVKIISNNIIELTPDEMEEVRTEAKARYLQECLAEMRKKNKPKVQEVKKNNEPTLF